MTSAPRSAARATSHGTCPCARRLNRSSACVTQNQLGERLPHHRELVLRYAPLRCTLNLTQRLDLVGRKLAAPDCRLEKPRRLTRLEEIRRMGACCQLTRSKPFPRAIPTRIEEIVQMLIRGHRGGFDRADRAPGVDSFTELPVLGTRRIAQGHRVEQLDHLRHQ